MLIKQFCPSVRDLEGFGQKDLSLASAATPVINYEKDFARVDMFQFFEFFNKGCCNGPHFKIDDLVIEFAFWHNKYPS